MAEQVCKFPQSKSCWEKFKYWCAGLNEVLCCLATLWPEIPNNIQIIWGILPSKLVNNLIEIPKSFNPNINLYHFQPKNELCWRINYFLVTQREIKYLGIFGQNFEILIVVSQPAFTAGTKNSLLNATIREEAMQP